MKLIFLGTGTSFGVPQLGCGCAVCHSNDPRDKRTRVGAVVESAGGTRILIDTPPELRLQLIATGVDRVDAVLYTHDHADHVHGIDDLRAITVRQGAALPVYGPADALGAIARKFRYIFDDSVQPLPGTSKPQATIHPVEPGQPFIIGDLEIVPVTVPHGGTTVFGYRIGPAGVILSEAKDRLPLQHHEGAALGYVTDAKSLPPEAMRLLAGVKVLVVNALLRTEHPTHLSLAEAVSVAAEIGAARTYLTHLTHHNFHADLETELPSGIAPAFDGLTVRID